MLRTCRTCNVDKSTEFFYTRGVGSPKLFLDCKECISERVTKPNGKSGKKARRLHLAITGMGYCYTCNFDFPIADLKVKSAASKDRQAYQCERCGWNAFLMMMYSISADEYEAMFAAQGGGCKMCRLVNADGRRLAVDHDHRCCPGKRSCGVCIRGLLCHPCNAGIGLLKEDVDLLAIAIDYLNQAA